VNDHTHTQKVFGEHEMFSAPHPEDAAESGGMRVIPEFCLANTSTVAGNPVYWQRGFVQRERASLAERCNVCPKCTLPYPCQHVSAKEHAELTRDRWATYPAHPDAALCVEFEHTGFCTNFARRQYCRFHHDAANKMAQLVIPLLRCEVCTLPVKKRCYVHNPPVGRKLCKEDRELVVDGTDVEERFVFGETVAIESASAGGYVYGVVVKANKKGSRMYTVCISFNQEGRFSGKCAHKSMGRLHQAQYPGLTERTCVQQFLGIQAPLTAAEKRAAAAEARQRKKDAEQSWGGMFDNIKAAVPDEPGPEGGDDSDSDEF
jgi:hypothetical protein